MFENVESWLVEVTGTESIWWFHVFLVVFTALLLGYMASRIFNRISTHAAATKSLWDDALVEAARKPFVWLVWVLGINIAAGIATRAVGSGWSQFIEPVNRAAVILLLAMFLLNFVKRAESNLVNPDYLEEPLDTTTVRAMAKLLRASIIISAVLIAMQMLGFSISGVLAFGGIGGLAVGFAAKDLLSNFFGGLMIYLDRPFSVGDWIRSPDQEIEGTVEDIGWRLTRIRTFDKRPLYIPNGIFASISVENPSRMLNRRIYETIGLRYEDINSMGAIVADVKTMLENHPEIDTTQTLMVNFNSFAASSVDFFIYTMTKTTNWEKYHGVKQDVLLKIADIIASHKAEIAFPTSTLHIADQADGFVVPRVERR
ncbi:MAG: mechanosensitive ion channel family protein [Gammaproteobacteria bacterium]|nr:mechanosensitive ion channel family protein [Gammaproteobacteria bacterium]MBQ0840374.1 mechanosensitive ion channel family protein [Gammaproteobacteria bacterium]